ncbi:MAG: hypothetical protein Fur0028_15850 [Bacteroidales bacterium]
MHTIEYINKLKNAKFNDEQITAIAEILTDIEEKQKVTVVTNERLDKTIAELKYELIKWIIGVGIISITTISGIMFTLLKLMAH